MCLLIRNVKPNISTNGNKASWTTAWQIMCSLPWEHYKKCMPIEYVGWQHMQLVKPKAIGWERPNPICNVTKRILKAIRNDGMTKCAKSHAFKLKPHMVLTNVMRIKRHENDVEKGVVMQFFWYVLVKVSIPLSKDYSKGDASLGYRVKNLVSCHL